MSERFVINREKAIKEMDDNSVLVLFAGSAPVKRGDAFYKHTPERNIFYLTGIDVPEIMLMIIKHSDDNFSETLFLERYDELTAKWDGAVMSIEKASEISGIENCKYIDEFEKNLSLMITRRHVSKVYIALEDLTFKPPFSIEQDFAKKMRDNFPTVKIKNAVKIFAKLREIKEDWEIENIAKGINITNEGLLRILDNVKPGMMEYELEAHFDYTVKKNGCCDFAFNTILAAGDNATVLHYVDNNTEIKDGDLVLLDFGAAWNWYSADITRTFPANGKFTERQKVIYNIVLGANELIIEKAKPGMPFTDLNKMVLDYYEVKLKEIGLINDKSEVSKYYYHGVSHMLGLETHDIGRGSESKLKEGMVFTVEPGLYISEEGIGVRIEDDVVVTKDGLKNLSSHIIKTVDEIEAYMAKTR